MSETILSEKTLQGNKKVDVFEGHTLEVEARTKRMLMFLIVFAVVMMFGGFTSAYIVMAPQAFWVHPEPVSSLVISNILVVLSSLLLIGAGLMARKGKKQATTILLILTFLAGLGFTLSQWNGWQQLNEKGFFISHNEIGDIKGEYGVDYMVTYNAYEVIHENGQFYKGTDVERLEPVTEVMKKQKDNSTSLLFLLVGVHAFHVLLGLIYLVFNIIRSIKGTISEKYVISLGSQSIYWHFMGILWLFLYAFLFIFH